MAVTIPIEIPGLKTKWIDGNLKFVVNIRLTSAVKLSYLLLPELGPALYAIPQKQSNFLSLKTHWISHLDL